VTTILIQPAGPRDARWHEQQYEQLRAALEAEGHSATVELPMERRGLDQVALDLAIRLGEDAAVGVVTEAVKRFLRNFRRPPSGEPRTATIYGPRGDVLATVELEDDGRGLGPQPESS
jgi:hypothetical protein